MAKQLNARRSRRHRGVKVLQLADGRHVARWIDPISGKQQQQSLDRLKLTTKEARAAWAAKKAATLGETRAAVAAGVVTAQRATLAKTVEDYLADYANEGTKENKRIVLDAFVAWCKKAGIVDAQDLVPVHLAQWRQHLFRPTTSKHKTSTRNRWLIAVAVFLNWCRGQGLVPMLNGDAVKQGLKRAVEPKKAIEILRPQEITKLLQAAMRYDASSPWVGAKANAAEFLLLTLLTGMRLQEVRRLQWNEVDMELGEIRLPHSRTKTQEARTIDLRICPVAIDLLRSLKLRTPGPDVFPSWTQGRVEMTVTRLRSSWGAPFFSMHTLRRTCGTLTTCAQGIFAAASAYMTAKRLGHSIEIAEQSYLGVLRDLPADAKTIEAAAGIEQLARTIVKGTGAADAESQAVAQ